MRRRTLLASAAGLTVGGIGVAQLPNESTAATVQQNTLTVGNRQHSTGDGEITDVLATVEAEVTIDASEAPDSYKLSLVGGPTDASPAVLTYVGGEFTQTQETVTETLSASVLRHDNLSAEMFNPAKGETVVHTLEIGVELAVFNAENETVAEDSAYAEAEVSVEAPAQMQVDTTVSGEGFIEFATEP
jgi:hypothetical protein